MENSPVSIYCIQHVQSFVERKVGGEAFGSFPYGAPVVSYFPPSSGDVSEKVAETGGKPGVERNMCIVQKKGYMSDEELDDIGSPLTSFIEQSSPRILQNGNAGLKSLEQTAGCIVNSRYELLREVWSL